MVVNTFFYDAWYNFNFQPFYVDLVNTQKKDLRDETNKSAETKTTVDLV